MKVVSLLILGLSVLVAVAAAGQLSAQTTTIGNDMTSTTGIAPMTVPSVSASPATSTATPVVQNLVEITRMVPAGTTAVTAFTVPAGQTLIVTDVIVTNTGDTPTCGAAINRAGTAAAATTPTATAGTTTVGGTLTATGTRATGTTTAGTTSSTTATMPGTGVQTLAGTITHSDSSITGPLCVAARTSTPLPFTTGIEFGPGQTVQLMNVPDTTTTGAPKTATTTTGSIGFHLRGMLVAA